MIDPEPKVFRLEEPLILYCRCCRRYIAIYGWTDQGDVCWLYDPPRLACCVTLALSMLNMPDKFWGVSNNDELEAYLQSLEGIEGTAWLAVKAK